MNKLIVSGILLITGMASGCGGSAGDPPRQLVSIQVSPASADAKNFANGQVQFSATGTYSDGTAAPVAVMWSANPPFTTVADFFLLSNSGVGQCVAGGTTGNMTVFATAAANPSIPLSQMTALTKNVTGSAQLVCP